MTLPTTPKMTKASVDGFEIASRANEATWAVLPSIAEAVIKPKGAMFI
jgi:hypothetical protein